LNKVGSLLAGGPVLHKINMKVALIDKKAGTLIPSSSSGGVRSLGMWYVAMQ
jgi:hypothetical protein